MVKKFIIAVIIVAFLATFLSGCLAYTQTSQDDILSLIYNADMQYKNFEYLKEITPYHNLLIRAHLYEEEKGIVAPVSDAGDAHIYVSESSVSAAAKLIYGNTVKIAENPKGYMKGAKYIPAKKAYAYYPSNFSDGYTKYIVKSTQSGNTITATVVLLRYTISDDKVYLTDTDEDGNRIENMPEKNGELLTTEQVKAFGDKLPQREYTIKKRLNGTLWIKSCRTKSAGQADYPDKNSIDKARKAAYDYISKKDDKSKAIEWKNAQIRVIDSFNDKSIKVIYADANNKRGHPVDIGGMAVYEVSLNGIIYVDKNTLKVLGEREIIIK